MKFRLNLIDTVDEEIVATVRKKTPLVEEIERLCREDRIDISTINGYREDEIYLLDVRDIDVIYLQDTKTYVIDRDGITYLIKMRLYEIEESIGSEFVKINKSCIIRLSGIEKFSITFGGVFEVKLRCGYIDYVSRRRLVDIKRRLNI